MKRSIVAVLFLLLVVSVAAPAQTWENFWHPRPHAEANHAFRMVSATPYLWEFKPSFSVSASSFRPGENGTATLASFLSAAGPALTLQRTSTALDGSNYADFSVSLVLLVTGNSVDAPTLRPAVGLVGGVLNNLVNLGVGYDLAKRTDGYKQFFFLVSIGVNLTNN